MKNCYGFKGSTNLFFKSWTLFRTLDVHFSILIKFLLEISKQTENSYTNIQMHHQKIWVYIFYFFFQVGSLLLARVRNLETSWISDLDDSASSTDGSQISSSGRNASYLASMFNPELDLTLDDRAVLNSIRQLNFIQMKRKSNVLF